MSPFESDAYLEQHEGRVNIPILTELEWFL